MEPIFMLHLEPLLISFSAGMAVGFFMLVINTAFSEFSRILKQVF